MSVRPEGKARLMRRVNSIGRSKLPFVPLTLKGEEEQLTQHNSRWYELRQEYRTNHPGGEKDWLQFLSEINDGSAEYFERLREMLFSYTVAYHTPPPRGYLLTPTYKSGPFTRFRSTLTDLYPLNVKYFHLLMYATYEVIGCLKDALLAALFEPRRIVGMQTSWS